MLQSDYTKKTQEIAQDRRYVENLQADLSAIRSNPGLAEEFKRLYPEKYHGYLDLVMSGKTNQGQNPGNAQGQSNAQVDPRLEKVFKTVEALEKERHEEKVSQRATEIDSAFSKFQSKYPLSTPSGDESFVINKAMAVLEQGNKLDDKTWEKIFKDAHLHFEKAYQGYYKQTQNQQKTANLKGRDMGAGGGVPGGAPKSPKTIKEATALALEDLGGR